MAKITTEQVLAKLEEGDTGDVTALGVGEAALQMGSYLGGALAGTAAGAYEAIKQGDVFAYAPTFEYVTERVNDVVMYEPKTAGGEAAVRALGELWEEYISEPVDEYLVDPNVENNNPLVAAIAKGSGEGLPMFLGMKLPVAKPIKVGGKYIVNKGVSLTQKAINRVRGKDPAVKEALVDVKTGEPVIDATVEGVKQNQKAEFFGMKKKAADPGSAPVSDKGASMNALKEFFKLSRDPSMNPHEGVGRILKPVFYKPVQVLRDWGSPTLAKMADAIYAPTKADAAITKAVPKDLIEMSTRAHGRFGVAWDTIIEPFKNRFNSVKKSHGTAITRGLRTGKAPKQYLKAIAETRELLDVLHQKYILPVLPEVGYQPNFVPQVWNVPHILKYPGRAKAFLTDKMGFDPAAAETTLRRIVESEGSPEFYETGGRLADITDYPIWSGRIRQRGGATKSSSEKARKIHIPEEVLPFAEEFLLNNIGDIMPAYVRNMTKRVEYSRLFGAKEEVLNASVLKAIEELGIEKNAKMIEDLTADVYGLADALQGKYRPIKSLRLNKWNRRLANYETVLHLGLVSLASFPEIAAPAIQFGLVPKAYAKGVLHAVAEATGAAERVLRGKRSIPKLKAHYSLGRPQDLRTYQAISPAGLCT
jgi:hypothetical protein